MQTPLGGDFVDMNGLVAVGSQEPPPLITDGRYETSKAIGPHTALITFGNALVYQRRLLVRDAYEERFLVRRPDAGETGLGVRPKDPKEGSVLEGRGWLDNRSLSHYRNSVGRFQLLTSASQSLAWPSALTVTSMLSSGDHAARVTESLWPFRVNNAVRLARSQMTTR